MPQLIDYWSYSSMSSLLNNPMAFKKMYVLKQYDNQTSPSALVGSAGHRALELYYTGMSPDDAIAAGHKLINETSDLGINYGKTGTREAIVASYVAATTYAFEQLPEFHELLGIEESITTEIQSITGAPMPLPAKSKMDVIARNNIGELEIHDWKFTKAYTSGDVDDFKKWLQGMFYYYVILAKFGEAPKRIVYQEIKLSKNRDSTPQRQPYTYEYGSNVDFATFEKLYNACTDQINLPGYQFLPNPNDFFNGQDTFEIYRQGIMTTEAPIVVPHKTEQVKFADKQYVPQAQDRGDNQHLSKEERIRLKVQEFVGAVEMQATNQGPSVTQYTFKAGRGIRMSKLASLDKDLQLALESKSVRVEAPIPGTGLIGVEVPSDSRKTVNLAKQHMRPGTLSLPIGVNVHNEVIYADLADMPHLLVAGATGAGKSVFLNCIIKTLTDQLSAKQLELVLIDPKQVEFAAYEKLDHLTRPVVYSNAEAAVVLDETVAEMERRYDILRKAGVRNIGEYKGAMPYRVVILDEFADLMMGGSMVAQQTLSKNLKPLALDLLEYLTDSEAMETLLYLDRDVFAGKKVRNPEFTKIKATVADMVKAAATPSVPDAQDSIIRIAQKARAVGIHLILATQRPSAEVVTGLIKSNLPTKVAFMATNRVNSQIILDEPGAEELTGKGDMLFADPGHPLQRLQGLYI